MGTKEEFMDKELRILILEDVPRDAELVERELQKAGIVYTSRRVDQKDAFLKELEDFSPDIVLSDYMMPRFNGMEALQLVKEHFPSIPLIIVTGSMNEETAVACMKAGAADYVIKEHLGHLGASVKGALENKRIREENEALQSQLQQAQKMEAIGTLAGGIAHDFNNILGGILGYAELARMKLPENSDIISDLDQVIKSSSRAADLVKQILTVSHQHKKEQRPIQIRDIVNEVLRLLKATLPSTIEIRENLLKETGIVNADPTQMHQVIMNLCTNAGHAMQKDGGVLTVELANVKLEEIQGARHLDMGAGSYLRLTVSDTGHGMNPDVRERIFDPYFTTKDTGEGTGLGLSVAMGIIKVHGGTITVSSQPDPGTTFHVYLPHIQEKEREEKEAEGPLPTGSERILFVDDEQILIELGRQMLGRLGYEVVTRQSSIEALALFRAEPDRFDLVITDMTMPHMTGDKLVRELLKIRPDMPIILCTGHSKTVSKEKAKEMGVKAFVMKPILRRTIAETVREALD
jgi:signal transduction histidine kinase